MTVLVELNTKVCYKCKIAKSITSFHKGGKRNTLHSYCKSCNINQRMERYRSNPSLNRENSARSISRNRNLMIDYLLQHPCVSCQETDIELLEFDHLRDKKSNVSTLVSKGCSWERIISEIAKCEVVCVKCHRHRTNRRAGAYRLNQ